MNEQFVLDLATPEPPSFDNFVVGSNGEAVAAVRSIAAGAMREPGVLLWGPEGAGKSHLLSACARSASFGTVIHCDSPQDVPTPNVGASTLLIVDDIDRAGATEQGRIFTWINALAANDGRWLASACAPPARLGLREDLRTRVALGLVFEVAVPGDAERAQALEAYAHDRGFRLSRDVIEYVLAHARRDMPSLVRLLAALDRHSLATQRSITVPLVREFLRTSSGGG